MKYKRIIARLDVKGTNVVKGVHFECLRVIGKPGELAKEYYLQGADELIYIDTVANLYERENLFDIVNKASEDVFIPFTIGGGIRTLEDIKTLLNLGADKVAINTAAIKNPMLITEASEMFGSQCIVISIEAQRKDDGSYEAYTDNGRMSTGIDVIAWAKRAEELGAGEILLTSVENEGTKKGLDINLINQVTSALSIPVIASGGVGCPDDVRNCFLKTNASAVAMGSLLHYKMSDVEKIKSILEDDKILIRKTDNPKRIRNITGNGRDILDYNKYTRRHLSMAEDIAENIPHIEDLNATIGVIDYGINNVKSVQKAFKMIGKESRIIKNPAELKHVKALILPGVGAFGKGMQSLQELGFVNAIQEEVLNKKPLLGICLGMQMLFSTSEEFGTNFGLDLIKGNVVKLKHPDQIADKDYRLPHIGWNKLKIYSPYTNYNIVSGIDENQLVYFVHSYYPEVNNSQDILATTQYGGQEFCVAVRHKNVFGTQFHPEKSGVVGLKILAEFCKINKI